MILEGWSMQRAARVPRAEGGSLPRREQRLEFRARVAQGDAVRQSADQKQVMAAAIGRRSIDDQRQPDLCALIGDVERWRHHPDDGTPDAVDVDGLSNEIR